MKSMGLKLRELRKAYKLNQTDFGKKIGATRVAINSYERDDNKIPIRLLEKITKTTGIGIEYFQSDMSIEEAFEKFNLNPQKLIMDSINEVSCEVYSGLEKYSLKESEVKEFKLDFVVLKVLFGVSYKQNYSFIKALGNEASPIADDGDILLVTNSSPRESDFVIARLNGNVTIAKYCLAGLNKIALKTLNKIEITLDNDEFARDVEILGIIVATLPIHSFRL